MALTSFYVLAISFTCLFSTISICICAASIYYLLILDSSSWINKTYRNLTSITILLFTISCIGLSLHMIVRFVYFPNDNLNENHSEIIIEQAVNIPYFFGNIIFYILLLIRIYQTFGLSKYSMYALSALIFIIFCSEVL